MKNPDRTCQPSMPDRHYATTPYSEICQLNVDSIVADNAFLFLWVVSPSLDKGIEVGIAWDFECKTVGFVWDKQYVNPGSYTLSQWELCLIFKGGKIPQPRGSRNVRQLVPCMWDKYSEKLWQVQDRIVQRFPPYPKIELFARERFDRWNALGNQVESDIES